MVPRVGTEMRESIGKRNHRLSRALKDNMIQRLMSTSADIENTMNYVTLSAQYSNTLETVSHICIFSRAIFMMETPG